MIQQVTCPGSPFAIGVTLQEVFAKVGLHLAFSYHLSTIKVVFNAFLLLLTDS